LLATKTAAPLLPTLIICGWMLSGDPNG